MYKTNTKFGIRYLWLLLILPIAFLFTACGQLDETATVNKSGNFAAADTSELNEVLGTQTKVSSTSFRVTITATLTILGQTGDVFLNAIVNETGLAAKMVTKSQGKTVEAKMYLSDGKLYTESEGVKTAIEYTTTTSPFEVLKNLLPTIQADVDLSSIIASIDGTNNILEKSGNNFKISLQAGQIIYLNFDSENNLVALQSKIESGQNKIEVTMSNFDGQIEYPDFSGYESA